MKFGSNIKTARTFRNNIQDIIDISKKKKEKLIIMTFAYNNLDNVDIYKNEYKYCYYKERKCPTAMWGLPNNVIKGLETHNNIIKETAEKSKEVLFIDQEALIPKENKYFNDICHLTNKGSELFVDNILKELQKNNNIN